MIAYCPSRVDIDRILTEELIYFYISNYYKEPKNDSKNIRGINKERYKFNRIIHELSLELIRVGTWIIDVLGRHKFGDNCMYIKDMKYNSPDPGVYVRISQLAQFNIEIRFLSPIEELKFTSNDDFYSLWSWGGKKNNYTMTIHPPILIKPSFNRQLFIDEFPFLSEEELSEIKNAPLPSIRIYDIFSKEDIRDEIVKRIEDWRRISNIVKRAYHDE